MRESKPYNSAAIVLFIATAESTPYLLYNNGKYSKVRDLITFFQHFSDLITLIPIYGKFVSS